MVLDYSRRRPAVSFSCSLRHLDGLSARRLDWKRSRIYPAPWFLERDRLSHYLRALQFAVVAGRHPEHGERLLFWVVVGFFPGSGRKPAGGGAGIPDCSKDRPSKNRTTAFQQPKVADPGRRDRQARVEDCGAFATQPLSAIE